MEAAHCQCLRPVRLKTCRSPSMSLCVAMLIPHSLRVARLPGTTGALKRASHALGDWRLFQGFSRLKLNLHHADIFKKDWLRGHDLNVRPSGYEPDE